MEAFIRGCLFRLVDCRGYLLRHRRVNDFKALRRRVKSFRKVRRNRAAVLMAVHLDAHGRTIVIFLHDVADKLCFVDIFDAFTDFAV